MSEQIGEDPIFSYVEFPNATREPFSDPEYVEFRFEI